MELSDIGGTGSVRRVVQAVRDAQIHNQYDILNQKLFVKFVVAPSKATGKLFALISTNLDKPDSGNGRKVVLSTSVWASVPLTCSGFRTYDEALNALLLLEAHYVPLIAQSILKEDEFTDVRVGSYSYTNTLDEDGHLELGVVQVPVGTKGHVWHNGEKVEATLSAVVVSLSFATFVEPFVSLKCKIDGDEYSLQPRNDWSQFCTHPLDAYQTSL